MINQKRIVEGRRVDGGIEGGRNSMRNILRKAKMPIKSIQQRNITALGGAERIGERSSNIMRSEEATRGAEVGTRDRREMTDIIMEEQRRATKKMDIMTIRERKIARGKVKVRESPLMIGRKKKVLPSINQIQSRRRKSQPSYLKNMQLKSKTRLIQALTKRRRLGS